MMRTSVPRAAAIAVLLTAIGCLVVGPAAASTTSTGFTVWPSSDVSVHPDASKDTLVLSTTLSLVAGESRRVTDRLGATLSSSEGAEVDNRITCLEPGGMTAVDSASGVNHRGSGIGEVGLMESLLLTARVPGVYTCQLLARTSDDPRTSYVMTAVRGAPPYMTSGTWLRISSADEIGSRAWTNRECNSPGTFPTCVYVGGSGAPHMAHVFTDQDPWTAATDTTEVDLVGTFQITSCPNGTASCTSNHWGDSSWFGLDKPGYADFQSFVYLNQLNPDGSVCRTNRSDDDASPSADNDLGHGMYHIRDSVHHLPVKYHLTASVSPTCHGSRRFVLDLYVASLAGNPIKLDNGGFNVIQSVRGATTTPLPNVIGMTETQAVATLKSRALNPVTVSRVMNPAPVGTVFAQNSPGGTLEPTGSEVDLGVSLGQATVPNVIGSDQSSAIRAISLAGLAVGQISSVNSCVDPGSVQLQNPAGGVLVVPGTAVSFTITTCTSGGGSGPPILPK